MQSLRVTVARVRAEVYVSKTRPVHTIAGVRQTSLANAVKSVTHYSFSFCLTLSFYTGWPKIPNSPNFAGDSCGTGNIIIVVIVFVPK